MLTITPNDDAGSTTPLLNPILFTALTLMFPAQREQLGTTNPGQRRILQKGPLGRTLAPAEYGEQYILNCPFCGDCRGRMRISHTYDPGHSPYHWFCFNENCQKNPQFRSYLADQFRNVWLAAKQQLANGLSPAMPSVPVEHDSNVIPRLPEGMVSFCSLPSNHPAHLYLIARQFDHWRLSNCWRVGYSEQSSNPSPGFRHRIVIPFYRLTADDGIELLGWQARSLDDNPASPKYLTMKGMHKSSLVYTCPTGIATSDRLIIAEGVTDVWNLGRDAVALLGKTASHHQLKLIVEAARSRKAVLVALDADAEPEANDLIRKLQMSLGSAGISVPVVRCRPPTGQSDFGGCDGFQVRRAIADAMAIAATTTVSHSVSPRRSGLVDKNTEVPHSRKELAKQMVWYATQEKPIDAEARVMELGMDPLLSYIEQPLQPILSDVERVGLRVDLDRLNEITAGDPDLQQKATSLMKSMSPATGRIHTTLNALGVRTGRITSRKFDLQNLDRPLRSAIVADEGRQLICADFSAFEWRVAAAISNDEKLRSWCNDPESELYEQVACALLSTSREAVSSQARKNIKRLMMRYLNSRKTYDPNAFENWRLLSDLFPDFVAWRKWHVAQSLQAGYVRTLLGRMVAIDMDCTPESQFNVAASRMIQGTAADFFKQSLLNIVARLPHTVRLLLPHHDSILLDVPEDDVHDVIPLLQSAMETPPQGWPVRMPCKICAGMNWGEVTGV